MPKILIADDEPLIRELLVDFLEADGFETRIAACGTDALAELQDPSIVGVITDLRMPRGSGLDVLRGVNERRTGKRPVVILSTGIFEIEAEEALDLGADALVRKPYHFREILQILTRQLIDPGQRWAAVPTPQARLLVKVETAHDPWTSGHLRFGRGGFSTTMTSLSSFWEGQEIEFDLEEPAGRLRGTGGVRWVNSPSKGPGAIGVEILSIESGDLPRFLSDHGARAGIAFTPKDCR